jgi:N-acyl-D-amino-acid deacylase
MRLKGKSRELCCLVILASVFLVFLTAVGEAQPPTYDILIKGGRVFDGSGNPWTYTDIAVEDGRVAAVGRLAEATAERVIDASGLYVMPGIIDIHSHADSGFNHEEPRGRAVVHYLTQGITTTALSEGNIWNNDEGIVEITRRWTDEGIGLNAAMFVGVGTVRRMAMKEWQGTPTSEELEQMKRLVREAMDGGAFGIATATDYWPGHFNSAEEIIAMAKEVAPYEGLYFAHLRSEGTRSIWWVESDPSPRVTHFDAVKEMIRIGKESGIPVHILHIKSTGVPFWGKSRETCRLIEEARAEGLQITADQYPYVSSGPDGNTELFKWQPYLRESIPWGAENEAELRQELTAKIRARMETDAVFAQQVEKDVYHEILARGGAENMFVTEFEPRPAYVGKSLKELADLRGENLFQTARYLQLENAARIRSYSMSEEDIEYYLTRGYIAVATDGFGRPGVHPRSFGTFPRVIRKYVVDRKVITLPFFVRKATSLPASILRIEDRGWIKEGYWADIIAFDFETIRDRASFDEMDLHSDGVQYVIVNGQIAIDDGQYTGSLPGRVILRPGAESRPSTTN